MKQPNWKTPLILSATLLGVGTFAYWLQYSHKPKKEKSDIQIKKPIALPSEDSQIAMIRLKSGAGLIELKCESLAEKTCSQAKKGSGKWVITNPIGIDGKPLVADPDVAGEFIAAAANAIAVETIDLSEESDEKRKSLIDQYGISPEKRVKLDTRFIELVTADDKGVAGKRYAAWFGEEHPLGDKTFVGSSVDGNMNDKTVFLIANYFLKTNLGKTVTSFRDKRIFEFDRSTVTEFTAKVSAGKSPNGKLEAKKQNGLWTVNGYEASEDSIETTLSGISSAKATEFPEESAIKGLKPVVAYNVKAGDKAFGFELFEKSIPAKAIPGSKEKLPAEKHYYVKTAGKKDIFEVESVFRSNVDKGLFELRNKALFTNTEKVTATSIKAEGPGYSAKPEFEYVAGKWKAKDAGKNWEVEIATKMMDLLEMARVRDFAIPAPTGKEIMKLSIGDQANPEKLHLSFFMVKDKLYARNLNKKNNEAYLLDDSLKPTLPKTDQEWKIQTKPAKPAEAK